MNKDYSYCSGITCPIRQECKRYLPDPPDVPLWWIPPAYKENLKQCPHFEKTNRKTINETRRYKKSGKRVCLRYNQ